MEYYKLNWLPGDNYLFSLINQSKLHLEKFIMENYIQIKCNLQYGYAINEFTQMYQYDELNCFDIIKIRNDELDIFEGDIISILKKMIKHEYSLLVPLNTYFVKAYPNAGIHSKSHECNIYNYDEKKQLFQCRDFFDYEHYQEANCNFDEIREGILNYNKVEHISPNCNIIALKLKPLKKLEEVNIRKFYNELENFLSWNEPINGVYYGINWFDGIIEDLIYNKSGDYRIFEMHFLSEHIKLMIARFIYLQENKITSSLEQILERYYNFYKEIIYYKLKWMKNKLQSNTQSLENSTIKKETIEVLKLLKEEYRKLIRDSIK